MLNATRRTTLKYAAMLVLIVGLAWVGVSREDSEDGGLSSPSAQAAVARESAVPAVRPGRDVEAYPDPYFVGEAAGPEPKEMHDGGGYFYYQIY